MEHVRQAPLTVDPSQQPRLDAVELEQAAERGTKPRVRQVRRASRTTARLRSQRPLVVAQAIELLAAEPTSVVTSRGAKRR